MRENTNFCSKPVLPFCVVNKMEIELHRADASNTFLGSNSSGIDFHPPHWCLHLIVVRRFEYAGDPENYTSGSVATGRASLAGQVKV